MAIERGASQAWNAVLKKLGADAPVYDSPRHLAEMIRTQALRRPQWPDDAANVIRTHAITLRSRIESMPSEIAVVRAAEVETIKRHLARLAAQIERLLRVRFWPVRLFRLPKLRFWRTWSAACPDRATEPLIRKLAAIRLELAGLESHPNRETARLSESWVASLRRFEAAAASPEHAGAVAGLRMAELLVRRLPDTYTVFHDVTIDTGRWAMPTARTVRRHRSIKSS